MVLSLLVTLLLFVPACANRAEEKEDGAPPPPLPWQRFTSEDGVASLRFPADWKRNSAPNSAYTLDVQRENDARLSLMSSLKINLVDPDLHRHAERALPSLLEALGSTRDGAVTKRERISSWTARIRSFQTFQIEVDVDILGNSLRLLYVFLDGPSYLHTLQFASVRDSWYDNRTQFSRILETFEETSLDEAASPSGAPAVSRLIPVKSSCVSLRVPETWRELDIPLLEPCLSVSSPDGSLGILVVRLARPVEGAASPGRATGVLSELVEKLLRALGFEWDEARPGRVAGYPALRTVMRYDLMGFKFINELVEVDVPGHRYQLLMIAFPSSWERARLLFESILQSFRPGPDGPVKAAPRGAPPARPAPAPRPAPPPR